MTTKWNDLTKEQQEHFKRIAQNHKIPEGTTHLKLSETSSDTFLKINEGDYDWYWSSSLGSWKQILPEHFRLYGDRYPLPTLDNCKGTRRVTEYNPLKESKSSALDIQEGGNHYKKCKIQPLEYIYANGIGYLEGNVIKYVTRHKDKNGVEDIKKAMHYLELILEMEYGDKL